MLGPCLFVIYINDIDDAVDTVLMIKKFADDTKGCGIANTIVDCHAIQEQLDNIFNWSVEWQMLFNMDKCKVIHLGKNNRGTRIRGTELIKSESEKYLGVYIHHTLSPGTHIAEAVKEANKKLGQLLRSVSYRDKVTFVNLYKQHVRCHLEYAVQCWNPWLQKHIDLIENVQKRAVRCVQGLNGSYEEKLKQNNLTTL